MLVAAIGAAYRQLLVARQFIPRSISLLLRKVAALVEPTVQLILVYTPTFSLSSLARSKRAEQRRLGID